MATAAERLLHQALVEFDLGHFFGPARLLQAHGDFHEHLGPPLRPRVGVVSRLQGGLVLQLGLRERLQDRPFASGCRGDKYRT